MMKGEITRKEYDSAVSNKKITYALSESTEHKFKEEYTENGLRMVATLDIDFLERYKDLVIRLL